MMTSELEYLDSDCEMTVLPQPKAPGIAVVPPWTHLFKHTFVNLFSRINLSFLFTERGHPAHVVQSTEDS